ncbi:exocyst complex component SEC5B-like isoform X1 [Magnolia sinica]|uniref:exocyst complex component SEC5B-like isoform X1 n=2 Tax=Magnolia sinica TaxID=86752 RepID=UPI0026587D71|nr:exocyst complex component SEC5B-like isoform X1 [Magnolia sinica]
MLSDSEDDELLQRVLQEQDRTAAKPPPPPFLNDSRKNKKPSRGGADDDDDSDLEILSISSSDEDQSSKDNAARNNRGRRPTSRKGGGGERDADRGATDDEPSCWKRVDETELGRRVREMRETRVAPVVLNSDKKGPQGKKGLSNLQSLPRGMEFVDPLGLGIISSRSLMLITDAPDSSPAHFGGKPDKDTLDASSREKFMYFSDKFDAKLFLSRVHQYTCTADLEYGALSLKTDLEGKTKQKKQLVKENFDCFVSCKTTIDDIESKLKRIEDDPEGAGTAYLHHSMHNISSLANSAFEPLFERQVQAEKIRSVQGMLQRFRTLFNLPSAIRGSISKGEFDLAVREYRKAKSIVLPSHVGILKRVLEEAEKVMHEFKGTLYKSMEDPQIDLAELENTVRLLLELEPDSDPLWHYLNLQNCRIRGMLDNCTLDHKARLEALHNEIQERVQSDARWRQIQQNLNKSSDVDYSLLLGDSDFPVDSQPTEMGEEVNALRERYICRLTAVLIHHLPAFWRLALSVFSGKFVKSSQVAASSMLSDAEPNVKPVMSKTDDKINDVKYSSHSLDEVAEMVHGTISAYASMVHSTFCDLEESNTLHPYMHDSIKEISKACQAMEGKESAPPSSVKALRGLHSEVTKIYILRLCSWMRATTGEIAKDESWFPVPTLERNKSLYTISFLPLVFHAMIVSAMDQINMMIQNLRSEATKSDDMFLHVQEIQESVRIAFLNCCLDFAGYLERIGSELSETRSNKEMSYLENGYIQGSEGNSVESPSTVVDSHQKMLMVLSNIGYCKDQLSYELYNKYKNIWLQAGEHAEADSDIQDLVSSYSALEEKVLEQYTYAKARLIRSAAVNYLLDTGIQWGGAPAVKGVRDATVDLVHTLVAVHAEVFAGAKPLLEKTLGILVEGLFDTFISLFHEKKATDLKSLDGNGYCQLMLELEYFETILNTYFTPYAREALKTLQELLLEKASECVTESVDNPSHLRRPTRGAEDIVADDRQQGMAASPDDLIALAQQYSSELLQAELERTRVNIACFMEPLEVPENMKAAYSSFQGSMDSSSRHQEPEPTRSPSRQRRR